MESGVPSSAQPGEAAARLSTSARSESPLMESHTPSQADLGKSVLSCMDVGQNAAFSQQRGSGALDL